ncbi:TPA: phage tail protein [Providencia rettgeri]|nr:phage tail protein [Providencia rettgeri]HEM6890184.1 phage tail protein [Providencia rettgeri]
MTKIFKIPFATQGDRTSIPDDVQADGAVSYTQGYSYDYERDQITDPAAKDIEREKMNGMFHDITEAIGELQSLGLPKWAAEAKPYPIRAIVYHKNKAWQSKVENNSNEPAAGAAWHELKADLTASDINVYNKTESDKRFQPLGNYLPAGYSYSKVESDTLYQPKGNYAPAGNYALKGESYTKAEADGRYQPKGSYQPAGDYATNSALTNGLNTKLNISSVVQATGSSTTAVMSQKAVTDALQNAVNLNTIYPVGIVVWFAQNKNPNTLFPGTKWQYIGENKTIRLANSSGNNVLSSGGSDSVTIGKGNLPAVPLKFSGTTSSNGGHTHNRGTMNITGEFANNGEAWKNTTTSGHAAGAFTRMTTRNVTSHTETSNGGCYYSFDASKTWSGATSNNGAHTHTYSGNTENLGSGTALAVTNAYIMLMGWYRIS